MQKRYLRPTPFLILSLIITLYLLFELVTRGGATDGWLFRMGKLLLPVIGFMVVVDLLLKYVVSRVAIIVAVEAILCVGLVYYWVIS